MSARSSRWLIAMSMLLLSCAGCAAVGVAPAASAETPATNNASSATALTLANTSSAHFTFSGDHPTTYMLQTTTPASELRHGHREFTILLSDKGLSLFIVFYGYQGPGNYTLSDAVNGGDIHIGLEQNAMSWDLLMQPAASCSLTVASDIPTSSAGLDRMRGSFDCPLLLSSSPSHPQKPVQISSGSFDIAILVVS